MLLLETDFAFSASAIRYNVEAQFGIGGAMREVARPYGTVLKRMFATAVVPHLMV